MESGTLTLKQLLYLAYTGVVWKQVSVITATTSQIPVSPVVVESGALTLKYRVFLVQHLTG